MARNGEPYILYLDTAEATAIIHACEAALGPSLLSPGHRRAWRKIRELRDRVIEDREPMGAAYRRAKAARRRRQL